MSEPSFGVWKFCKRTQKRYYVDLSGRKLIAGAAFRQFVEELNAKGGMLWQRKQELCGYMLALTIEEVALCANDADANSQSSLTDLSFWGIPPLIQEKYKSSGVLKLYDWQAECLVSDNCSALRGRNFLYTAPTSGGKTMVTEVLMLRQLARNWNDVLFPQGNNSVSMNRTIMYVVPFISIAEEKLAYFQHMWSDYYVRVRAYHGEAHSDGVDMLGKDVDIAICTIEKANIIVTHLMETRRISQLSMVVVDEIHLLSDSQRGYLLEVLLAKILHVQRSYDSQPSTQRPSCPIVGMSATLPNIAAVGEEWLRGSVFVTNYRPVRLHTYLCTGADVFAGTDTSPSLQPLKQFPNASLLPDNSLRELLQTRSLCSGDTAKRVAMDLMDQDRFLQLCFGASLSAIDEDASFQAESYQPVSTMIFCSSKLKCEKCVERILKAMQALSWLYHSPYLFGGSESTQGSRKRVMAQLLSETAVGLCPVLQRSVPYGVAYHHAGLTAEERKARILATLLCS